MKCRNVCFLFLLAAVLVFIPGWSAAVDQNATIPGAPTGAVNRCQQHFKSLDKNHDGKITKEELQADRHLGNNVDQVFQAKDLDKKGYLTEEDFCKGMGKGRGEHARGCETRFEALDKNGDKTLSPKEFAKGRRPGAKTDELFKRKDTNSDGKLTLEEFCGSRKTQKPPTQ